MTIHHTILAAHLDTNNEASERDAQSYADACNAAIRKLYPDAEIKTRIVWNVEGAGSGISVDCDGDSQHADEITRACDHVCQVVFESGEFWS